MSWADAAIAALNLGHEAVVSPRGNSMTPRVKSGQHITLLPLAAGEPSKGDVVLVKVHGRVYLHLVVGLIVGRYQIGNNHGGINGWVGREAIYGKADV